MSQILKSAAKTSIYPYNDGSGRDTYVSFSNGGNTLIYSPNAKHIVHGEMNRSSSNFKQPTGLIPPKTLHYDQNGTGRDTYILSTSGGLHGQFNNQGYYDQHVQHLREYNRTI